MVYKRFVNITKLSTGRSHSGATSNAIFDIRSPCASPVRKQRNYSDVYFVSAPSILPIFPIRQWDGQFAIWMWPIYKWVHWQLVQNISLAHTERH
jgi:hypothetical protein